MGKKKSSQIERIGQLPFPENDQVVSIEQPGRGVMVTVKKGAAVGPTIPSIPVGQMMENFIIGSNKLKAMGMPPQAEVKQIILGNIPSKSNCYKIITFKTKDPTKHAHASLAKTPALKAYENSFFIQCGLYRNKNIDEYFELEVDVYYPTQRSDLDNCLKVLLDCLQKVNAIKNDNKCTRIVANKFLDPVQPRIVFSLKRSMK